jgi:superfamily II DNA or RNA helicase
MSVAIPERVIRRVADHFAPEVFARGLEYARDGRVNLVRTEWPVVARVRGNSGYVVTVHYEKSHGHIHGECSCSDASDCHHTAATALVAMAGAREHDLERQEARKQELVGEWLAGFELGQSDAAPALGNRIVAYVIRRDDQGRLGLRLCSTRALQRGGFGHSYPLSAFGDARRELPHWVRTDDLRRIALLRAVTRANVGDLVMPLERVDAALFADLAATGHLFWEQVGPRPLSPGPARSGRLGWRETDDTDDTDDAEKEYTLGLVDDLILVPGQTNHYIDLASDTIGELDLGAPAMLVQRLVQSPPVPVAMLPTVRRSLEPLLGADARVEMPDVDAEVIELPVLHLSVSLGQSPERQPRIDLYAEATYGDRRFALADWDARRPMPRDLAFEGQRLRRLRELMDRFVRRATDRQTELLAEARHVAHYVVPTLAEEGWNCHVADDFPVEAVALHTTWVESLAPMSDAHDWFALELGVVIAGRTVPLLPILLAAIDGGDLPLDGLVLDGRELAGINLRLPEGELVHVSGERLYRWLRPLLELRLRGTTDEGALLIPAFTAVDLTAASPGRFSRADDLAEARQRLERLLELEPRHEPAGFSGELRGYQRQGLAWLAFLHDLGYGGLLADDMGLGKTVQVLAFLETLREAGSLDPARPALVVAPRSVLGHWHSETRRFGPHLAPVIHLGAGRARTIAELGAHDVVITSYQTMLRDRELLEMVPWTTLVFDEAQALKNADTHVRRAAAALPARSRFGITGTPIENHLGELWSQMDLMMPGLLGRKVTFENLFRRAIEKYGDDERLELLRQRIRPFLLRRTKRHVELDLPDKTEIVEHVDLGASQRDLYESLRLTLDQDVRDALARKGVQGASMVVLNALLELRQCCCDPRLLALPRAKQMKSSAKLERLMSMLEELADNGHFVLVFSQFTSMLELIERACEAAGIALLTLTGKTRNREAVVQAFQAGQAPVMLVSLKAGGTGLNLTRADTVIHYDPWWNPAAEDQATDRAHRIGQSKQVFVYKLVARGTLEERIITMQEEKRRLTEAALHEGGAAHLVPTDLAALYRQLV